jgi:hypothetical protein
MWWTYYSRQTSRKEAPALSPKASLSLSLSFPAKYVLCIRSHIVKELIEGMSIAAEARVINQNRQLHFLSVIFYGENMTVKLIERPALIPERGPRFDAAQRIVVAIQTEVGPTVHVDMLATGDFLPVIVNEGMVRIVLKAALFKEILPNLVHTDSSQPRVPAMTAAAPSAPRPADPVPSPETSIPPPPAAKLSQIPPKQEVSPLPPPTEPFPTPPTAKAESPRPPAPAQEFIPPPIPVQEPEPVIDASAVRPIPTLSFGVFPLPVIFVCV